jgi:hypothetical protein
MENVWVAAIWAITPTLIFGVFFYFLLRSIMRADRNERKAFDQIEREERAKLGLSPKQ